jgi:hypothetical protein
VKWMLEDLNTLPPKRLEKELKKLVHDALPCHAATAFDGNPDDGITVALHIDPRQRRDILDLARVVEDDTRVHAFSAWSLLPPAGRRREWRLLLRVSFERPVRCDFAVNLDVREHGSDTPRAALPLLLAAHRLVFILDEQIDAEWPLVWIDAPAAREPVLELLTAVGV